MSDSRLRRALSGTLAAGFLLVGGLSTTDAFAEPKDKKPDQQPNDHPSGKDRGSEPAGSGSQGASPADPDGDSNGGMDKPGHSGGYDADRDGNNGCGNDDDFEDDNNGLCGGRRVGEGRANAQGGRAAAFGDVDSDVAGDHRAKFAANTRVRGVQSSSPTATALAGRAGDASVLGVVLTRTADGRVAAAMSGDAAVLDARLPRTGAETATIMVAGVLLVIVGSGTAAVSRRRVPATRGAA